MKNVLFGLAFHQNGKPRGWLRKVLFKRNQTPRKAFTRLVYKKNGSVRRLFEVWGKAAYSQNNSVMRKNGTPKSALDPNIMAVSAVLGAPSSMEDMAHQWKRDGAPKKLRDTKDLIGLLNSRREAERNWLVLCLGHDDYTSVSGGVQMCIQREEKRVAQLGGDYLNIHPWQPLPRLAHADETADPFVNLILNGSALATCRMSSLISASRALSEEGVRLDMVIHHLLGHLPEQVAELASAADVGKRLFWLHDFFSICPSFTLQRNNRQFCSAPSVASNACFLCLFGEERQSHDLRMKVFFRAVRPHVLSPSTVTLDFWQAHSDLTIEKADVVPHMMLEWSPRESGPVAKPQTQIVIGYLGHAATHKGWPQFHALATKLAGDERYKFVALSKSRPANDTVKWTKVRVSTENESAMSDAVRSIGVDIVLHWPTWPETFSLTTYEAILGGAFVVTNGVSGNVAATVTKFNKGAVLEDDETLLEFFRGSGASDLAAAARTHRAENLASSHLSDMSVPFLSKRK